VLSSPVLFVLHPVLPLFSASCSVSSRSWGTNASVSLRRNRGRKFALLCLVRSLSFSVCPGLFFIFVSPRFSFFSLLLPREVAFAQLL
jgi:hypothetical protein